MQHHTSYSNRNTGRNVFFILAVLVVCAAVVVAVVSLLMPEDDPSEDVSLSLPLVELTGTWTSETGVSRFTATVENNEINIELGDESASMLYWYGTFKESESPGAVIVSEKLETDKVVLSGADAKDFTIENDTIIFEFEAMGAKKKVVMTRG